MKLRVLVIVIGLASCTHEPLKQPVAPASNYPPEIAAIITTRCAVAGCHSAASYQTSGGNLRMDTWEHLFDGGNTGAAVVPFSPECSPLLYFTNSFLDLGSLPPEEMKMPLNNPALTREEYLRLRNWVLQGARDKDGNIPFASEADTRQKIYLAHQGCDYVTVIDAEKNVIMRCVPVGNQVTIESAYSLKVAPDGNAYFSFWGNESIFRMDTKTDSVTDEINTGYPNSYVLHTGSQVQDLLVTNVFANALLRINTSSKQITGQYGGHLSQPHGIASNRSFDTFFVTELIGNTVNKIAATGGIKKVSIDGQAPTTSTHGPNPYNIVMAPDYSKYFVSCAGSNEVRVMDAHSDTLIKVIPVGLSPRELAVSEALPYLFISCLDDPASIALYKGSVYVVNYNTLEVVTKITDRYYMPHALAVDDRHKKLFVFSRNIDPNGPVPHHSSSTCGGRNGYYSVYDFGSLKPVNNRRYEVTVDPFAADVRFK